MADENEREFPYTIRPFDGDYNELYDLIYQSWRADYKRSRMFLDYNPKWLEWTLSAPGSDKDLQVASYMGEEMVGFLCLLPRNVYIKDRKVKAVIGTLLTVHPEHRRRRIAWNMSEYARAVIFEKGTYRAMFGYLYTRRASAPLMKKLIKRYSPYGVRFEVIFRARHLIKVIDPDVLGHTRALNPVQRWYMKRHSRTPDIRPKGRVRPYTPDDAKDIMRLLNAYRKSAGIARSWGIKELEWQLHWPPVAYTYVLEDRRGGIVGVWNFHLIHACILDEKHLMAEVDNILLPNDNTEGRGFVAEALKRMKKERSIELVSIYNTHYIDTAPLAACDFVTYPRVLLFLGATYEDEISFKGIKSAYIDFR